MRVGGDGRECHGFRRCAFDADLLVDDLQIVGACFELARGHLENLIPRIDGCESRCGAGNQDATAADGASVPRAGVGIDVDDGNILHRHAELLGDNHWNTETGDGAHVDLADVHGHRAVFVDFDDRAAAWTRALDPGAGGEADALVLFKLHFAPADFFLGNADRLAQRNIAQLGHADDPVARLRHILQAKFHRVHAELGGDGVHVRFDGKSGLRAAGATHGTADLLVGVNRVAVDMTVGHQVPAAEHVGAAAASLHAEARVAAGVVKYFAGAGNDGAVLLHAGLDIHLGAGSDRRRNGFLSLVEDDHHRPLGLDRQQAADWLDGGAGSDAAALAAEAAAQASGDHAHVVQGKPERFRRLLTHGEGRLGIGPNGKAAVGLHLRRGDARLEILGMDHFRLVNFLDNNIRFGHHPFGIADMDDGMAANIFKLRVCGDTFRQRHVLVQGRRGRLGRFFRIDGHRQRFVDDLDFLERLLGDGRRFRGDGGHRVAHETDLITRENMAVEVTAAVTDVGRIGGGHHGVNAGGFLRLAGVDADYFCMRVLAAQDRAMQLVFEHQIDAVNALADDALDAAHAGGARTDDFQFRFGHDLSPPCYAIGGEMNRIDDLVVAGATADVAGDRFFDIFRSRFGGPIEQSFHRDNISRRAVAALHRAGVDERLLHRMQCIAVGETFDGRDLGAVGIGRHGDARVDRLAVINNRAGAALAGVAAKFRAFVFQRLTEKFQ